MGGRGDNEWGGLTVCIACIFHHNIILVQIIVLLNRCIIKSTIITLIISKTYMYKIWFELGHVGNDGVDFIY